MIDFILQEKTHFSLPRLQRRSKDAHYVQSRSKGPHCVQSRSKDAHSMQSRSKDTHYVQRRSKDAHCVQRKSKDAHCVQSRSKDAHYMQVPTWHCARHVLWLQGEPNLKVSPAWCLVYPCLDSDFTI